MNEDTRRRPLVQIVSSPDHGLVRLVLNNPPGNVFSIEMIEALRAAVRSAAAHGHVKLLCVASAGDDFSFGAGAEEHLPGQIERVLPRLHGLVRKLLAAPMPTAAIVRGRCLGAGFELAMACDVIFAADSAVFGLPEILLGVFSPTAAALLPAKVGAARAASAMLTGDARTAREWYDAGLIQHVSTDESLDDDLQRWYESHLASRSAAALGHAAHAARLWLRRQAEPVLEEAEARYLKDLMKTHDAEEAVRALLEKRQPRYTDA